MFATMYQDVLYVVNVHDGTQRTISVSLALTEKVTTVRNG